MQVALGRMQIMVTLAPQAEQQRGKTQPPPPSGRTVLERAYAREQSRRDRQAARSHWECTNCLRGPWHF